MSNVTTMGHDEACSGRPDCRCAVREMGWIAREARGLSSMPVPAVGGPDRAYWQGRWDAFTARKMALLAFVDATRGA